MKNWTSDASSLLLRLAAGAIFVPHGYSKVLGEGGAAAFAADMPSYGIPAVLGYVAAYSELLGGALLIAGLLTRIDAFLLACTMAVAAFVIQLPDALREVQPGTIVAFAAIRGIETPLALLATSAALLLTGGGRFSLDHMLGVDARLGTLFGKKKAAAEAAAAAVPKS